MSSHKHHPCVPRRSGCNERSRARWIERRKQQPIQLRVERVLKINESLQELSDSIRSNHEPSLTDLSSSLI